MRRPLATLGAGLILPLFLAAPAAAQDAPPQRPCMLVRVAPGGILKQCGLRLRSVAIGYIELSRVPTFIPGSMFAFVCPIESMCAGRPRITGWLIDHTLWNTSKRDEQAIFETFQRPPASTREWVQRPPLQPTQPPSDCGVLDLEVAGMPARGVCYRFEAGNSTALVVVAADDEIGFLLVFDQPDVDTPTLRDSVMQMLPHFRLQVDSGDAGLMMWMR